MGKKFQLSEPGLNSPDSSLLAVPKAVVREMLGKRVAAGGADIGVGGLEPIFRLQDIGAAKEHFGGHPGRNLPGRAYEGQGIRQQLCRHLRSDQKVQGVFVLSDQPGVEGRVHPCRIDSRLRLSKLQFGREPDVVTLPDQIVGGLLGIQGGLGQLEGFPVRREGQVRVGDPGHQQDLRAVPRLLGGKVLLERLVLQAADAAEEIDFPLADPEVDVVFRDSPRDTEERKIGGHALLAPPARCFDLRQEVSPRDAVHRTRSYNVQGGDPKVAVVLQGRFDDLPKTFVGEEFPPLNLGRRRCAGRDVCVIVCGTARPGGGDRRFGARVFRGHRAAGEKSGRYRKE